MPGPGSQVAGREETQRCSRGCCICSVPARPIPKWAELQAVLTSLAKTHHDECCFLGHLLGGLPCTHLPALSSDGARGSSTRATPSKPPCPGSPSAVEPHHRPSTDGPQCPREMDGSGPELTTRAAEHPHSLPKIVIAFDRSSA